MCVTLLFKQEQLAEMEARHRQAVRSAGEVCYPALDVGVSPCLLCLPTCDCCLDCLMTSGC